MEITTKPAKIQVAVIVCTAYRAEMLTKCLKALKHQIIPADVSLTVIVVDNEKYPNNRGVVARATTGYGRIGTAYVHEPIRGISYARNAGLEACRDKFHWIAFTDDDAQANDDWILQLLDTADKYGADVIQGHHKWVCEVPSAFWVNPERKNLRDGQELDTAATGNVLFTGHLAGLRFDTTLRHGEDTDFFHRAKYDHDARIIYSERAIVTETVPKGRATLGYQIRRSFYYAASRTSFDRKYKGISMAMLKMLVRFIWQVPIALIRLTLTPIIWIFSKRLFRRWISKGCCRIAKAAGTILGLFGYSGNPYRSVGKS